MIVSTKLHIPQTRSSLVARPRLMRKLDEGMSVKLTLVSAQAGYGKTTLLSEWVQQYGGLAAWVSLDKRDNDGIRFWSYVIASIRAKIPEFGIPVEFLLEKGPSVPLDSAISELLNELERLTCDLIIILDDYQFIELPAIHHSLTFLLEHLPSHIHLYILSRSDLTIPTARLLAKGELHRINMQDLRFQLDEGLAFFRETSGLALTAEQVKILHNQTEGWISGLQLAAISLKRSGNIARTIDQFSGQQHNISDYLLEEVLHHQSEPMYDFLLQTSILNRMNASLCQAVTGQMDAEDQLRRLEQLNLFIIPLDEQRNWYRYHHLFSDFLQRILSRSGPEEWIEAHNRAANWLEAHGFDEEAMEHYLEGKRYGDAVRLIEKNLVPWMQSKSVALIRWVSVLPENSFLEKPMIEMFYISVLLGVGEWEAAFDRVNQASMRFQAIQKERNDTEWDKVLGTVYFFNAVTSYLQKDLERMSGYFELMERYLPEGSLFQTMGRNRFQGYDVFDDHLAHIHDLHAADAFLLKWITVWGEKESYPFVGLLRASYSKLLYEWNRLEEAYDCVRQALGRPDIQPFSRILIHVAVSASRIEQARGNSARAMDLLERLKLQIVTPDYDLFMLKIEAEQACLSLQQGSTGYAREWLQSCGLAYTDEVSLYNMLEHLALARVLAATGQTEEALYLLERLEQLADREDRLRDRIRVLILQSVTLQRMGQTEVALARLETALLLAEPEGYIRSIIDEGPLMGEMLAEYLMLQPGRGISRSAPVSQAYVKQLLQALYGASDVKLSSREILTDQETRILQLISTGLSNKEIAQQLRITGETVKSHIKNLYRKLGASNRVQVLQRGKESNLL